MGLIEGQTLRMGKDSIPNSNDSVLHITFTLKLYGYLPIKEDVSISFDIFAKLGKETNITHYGLWR